MRGYMIFTKKELLEFLRSYKLMLILVIFLILGILSPLSAKFMPDIMKLVMGDNMTSAIPKPESIDSWSQFYKNIGQMGLIAFVVLCSGSLSNEITKGTLIIPLTKGLRRNYVILSKFSALLLLWTLGLFLAFLTTYLYTLYFWPDAFHIELLYALLCLWLFGIFLVSSVLLGSVLFKGVGGCILFVVLLVIIMILLNIFPPIAAYNPMQMVNINIDIIINKIKVINVIRPLITTCICSIIFITISLIVFRKKAL